MADEDSQGRDGSDDALDELGSLLSGSGDSSDDDAGEVESADLGALALSSRPRAAEAETVDLGPLALSSRPAASRVERAAGQEARVPTPRSDADADADADADRVPAGVRRGRGAVWLALALGFAAGLGSGAVLFRTPAADAPEAATPAPIAPSAMPAMAAAGPGPALAAAEPGAAAAATPAAAAEPGAAAAATPAATAEPGAAAAATPGAAVAATPSIDTPGGGGAEAPAARSGSGSSARPSAAEPQPRVAAGAPAAGPAPTGTLTISPAAPTEAAEPPSEGDRTLAQAFGQPAKAEPVPVGEERDMDDLLDQAFASPSARRERLQQEALLSSDHLPPTPSREQVNEAMAVLLPAIRGCAMGQSGLATASIVVGSEGKVASVSVAGAPFAGAASGRCMEGVIRKARFPRFSQPTFRVKFPFAIK